MDVFFKNNLFVLFVVLLLVAVASSELSKEKIKISLVYFLSYLVGACGTMGVGYSCASALIVSFLVLEIFNADEELLRTFSILEKVCDFAFKLLFQYHILLHLTAMIVLVIAELNASIVLRFGSLVFELLTLISVTRCRFEIRSISECGSYFTRLCPIDDALRTVPSGLKRKYDLVCFMEDKDFFSRSEYSHLFISGETIKRVFKRRNEKRKGWRSNDASKSNIHLRGYSTLEMQLIRQFGIVFGAYKCTIRRKAFEILYSNMIINSYLKKYSQSHFIHQNNCSKIWLIKCYINAVPVGFGNRIITSGKAQSSFVGCFEKSFDEASLEEVFVWCLGLPHYKDGVGENAIAIHGEAIREFGLSMEEIEKCLSRLGQS